MSDFGGRGGHHHGGPQGEIDEEIFAPFDANVFRRIYEFARPYRIEFAGAIAAVLAFVLAQLSIPYLIGAAVDSAVGKTGSYPLDAVLIAFVVLIVANSVANYLQEVTAARLAQRIIFDMRRAMFAHLQAVSLSFLDQTHVGRIM